MDQKALKKLNRKALLELLLQQTLRAEELEKELADMRAQLEAREIKIANSGSIAEAALELNHIFEVAQKAADDYLANVKRKADQE